MSRRGGQIGAGRLAFALLALLVALIAAATLAGCDRATIEASDLRLGDCFDVPDGTPTFTTIRRTSCDTPHSGEVFHIFDTTAAAGSPYPTDPDWETLIYPVCDPEFDAWTGTPIETNVVVRYRFLVPTKDEWDRGGRRVTCFLSRPDGAKLEVPLHVTPRPTG
ncbi:MAG TPA: septum formation family protein [Verrucomicrobiae bacterium]|nr:septum formation family protein [Verrucomicrobiae bacterium]